MLEVREGGCLCGLARFRALGEPLRAHACHCTFCQRRTGSAYAEVAYFLGDNIEITGGPLTTYTHRSDASGRWLRNAVLSNLRHLRHHRARATTR
ncbi:MAG: GFA family protein [Rubrivivax sp.]|nr:GFA family protein [Rubrivivax sp.]